MRDCFVLGSAGRRGEGRRGIRGSSRRYHGALVPYCGPAGWGGLVLFWGMGRPVSLLPRPHPLFQALLLWPRSGLGAASERPLPPPPHLKLLLLVAAAIKMLPAYGSMCCCMVAVHYCGGRLS